MNLVAPTEKLSIVKEDPDDDRIPECGAAARDYIVREEKDLLRLGNVMGTPVLTIRDFIDVTLGRGRRC